MTLELKCGIISVQSEGSGGGSPVPRFSRHQLRLCASSLLRSGEWSQIKGRLDRVFLLSQRINGPLGCRSFGCFYPFVHRKVAIATCCYFFSLRIVCGPRQAIRAYLGYHLLILFSATLAYGGGHFDFITPRITGVIWGYGGSESPPPLQRATRAIQALNINTKIQAEE